MTVFFYLYRAQEVAYTIQLLKKLCRVHNIRMTDRPDDCDVVFVSCCDINDIGHLRSAKKFNKPIVAGGFISTLPVMRVYADYVVQGEAFNFMAKLPKVRHISEIAAFENVATMDKQGIVDEYIDYDLNPLVRTSRDGYYYYSGKGCPHKCKYCLMSHTRETVQYCERERIAKAASMVLKGKLYPMVSYNQWEFTPYEKKRLGPINLTIKDYLNDKAKWNHSSFSCGLEFATERFRANLAKPVSPDDIRMFAAKTKNENVRVNLYMIAGLETQQEHESLFECFGSDWGLYPIIKIKYTYIDPQMFTPFEGFDIRNKIEIDDKKLFNKALSINRRIRIGTIKYIAHSTWRAIMQSAKTLEEAEFTFSLRNCKDNNYLLTQCDKKYPHLLGGKTINEILAAPRHCKNGLIYKNKREYA